MCNTVNDSSAESCKYCGYIFEDVSTSNTTSSRPALTDIAPENVVDEPALSTPQSGFGSSVSQATGSAPVFVLKSSWKDRTNLPRVILGLALSVFYILLNVPVFAGGAYSLYNLVFLVILIPFLLPIVTANKTYEFFDNSLVIRGVGSNRDIPYSEISGVTNVRGRIYLQMKNQFRQVRVQGVVKSNTSGMDLVPWLNQKNRK